MTELPAIVSDRTAVLLRAALSRAESMGEEALRPLGITGREYGALALLVHGAETSNQRHLGAALGWDRTTTMKLMTGLERRGLVRRDVDRTDRRSYRLEVTSSGRALVVRADRVLQACDAAVTDGLLAEEAALLRGLLRRLS